MKNKINFLISILTFLIISSISTSASEKIKIGLLLPLSGENKNIGTSVLRSVSMAVNKIDSSKLEILPKNNFDDPDQNYMAWKSWVAGGSGGLYIPSSNIYFGGSKTQFEPHGAPGGAASHFKIKQYSSASQLNPLRIFDL